MTPGELIMRPFVEADRETVRRMYLACRRSAFTWPHPAPFAEADFDRPPPRAALSRPMPLLGVCLGVQTLNVAAGGTLIQDLDSAGPGAILHSQPDKADQLVHDVAVSDGSRLAGITGGPDLAVNSTHHQAIDAVAESFEVVARAADGVIEAIERPGTPMCLGVQWHPERLLQHARHLALFKALVEQARP